MLVNNSGNNFFGIEAERPLYEIQPNWKRKEQEELLKTMCERCGMVCGKSPEEQTACRQFCRDGGAAS